MAFYLELVPFVATMTKVDQVRASVIPEFRPGVDFSYAERQNPLPAENRKVRGVEVQHVQLAASGFVLFVDLADHPKRHSIRFQVTLLLKTPGL
jgi:hypothetical protein